MITGSQWLRLYFSCRRVIAAELLVAVLPFIPFIFEMSSLVCLCRLVSLVLRLKARSAPEEFQVTLSALSFS